MLDCWIELSHAGHQKKIARTQTAPKINCAKNQRCRPSTACLHRAGTSRFSPSAIWGRDRDCPVRGIGRPLRGRRTPNAGCGKPRGRGQSPRAGFRGSRRLAVRPRVSQPTRRRGGPHAGFDLYHFISRCCPLPRYSADPLNHITRVRTDCNTEIQHQRVTDFRKAAERCRRARRWQCQGFRA